LGYNIFYIFVKKNIMKEWCIEQHRKTNHMYSEYLPYEFHLRMVAEVANDFKHLLDDTKDYFTGKETVRHDENKVTLRTACLRGVWAHDLCEDCRVSYNDVKNKLGQEVADIVYAVTNEKGKTRAERANDKYYEGIRNTPGAVFVKLCDRIANVQYSKMTKSRMFEMYKKENTNFLTKLGGGDIEYYEMVVALTNLLNE
jgi:(p)ppGpp synthase/HD superfamily hydrolase